MFTKYFQDYCSDTIFDSIYTSIGYNSKLYSQIVAISKIYAESNCDMSKMLDLMVSETKLTDNERIIWRSFFMELDKVEKYDDVAIVISGYENFINTNGRAYLTEDEINSFNYAFSIARYSIKYWYNRISSYEE